MEEEDYGQEGSEMEGGMVYQDEDGNLIMYHGDGMGEEDDEMGDEYGMEGSPEQEINFDSNPAFANMPPLDKMRKFRRDIIKSINEYRQMNSVPGVMGDILANRAASEYAEYLLTGEENEQTLNDILAKHMYVGAVTTLVGLSMLEVDEEDGDSHRVLHGEFMDSHGVLCEYQHDLERMIDGKYTHVGIGFAWNKEKVLVVEFYSVKPVTISQLTESEDGGVDIRGTMLSNEVGLYAARIVSVKNPKKDIKVVGPPNIQLDKATRNFIITIEGPSDGLFYSEDPKILEIYIRKSQIDKIQYGVASQERINVAHLELAMRIPMEFLPDPRTVIEDAHDREKEERDAADRRKREQEEKLVREAQRLVRQEEKKRARRNARPPKPPASTMTPNSTPLLGVPLASLRNPAPKRPRDSRISAPLSLLTWTRNPRVPRRCTPSGKPAVTTARPTMTTMLTRAMTTTALTRSPT